MPSIEMAYDNDAESEWCEIEGCVSNLAMSLSLAVFDNNFKKEWAYVFLWYLSSVIINIIV